MASRVLREGRSFTTPDHSISLWHPLQIREIDCVVAESKRIEYESLSITEDAAGRAIFADLSVIGYNLGIIASFGGTSAGLPEGWTDDKARISLDLTFARALYQREKQGFRHAFAKEMLSNPTHSLWVYHPRERLIRQRLSADLAATKTNGNTAEVEVPATEASRQEHMQRELESRSLPEGERVNWLASMMEDLAALGHDIVDQCQKCYASQVIGDNYCRQCKHHDLVRRPTNKGILEDIRYKFTCWGYGAASLRALPPQD
jgi:hypothetical protein